MSTEKDPTAITAPADTRQEIEGLVLRFARNLDVYTRPDYKETQVRIKRVPDLHKKLRAAAIPAEKTLYERQIEATDAEIDTLVYDLYRLTRVRFRRASITSMPGVRAPATT